MRYIGYEEAKRSRAAGYTVKIVQEAEGFGFHSEWDGVSQGDVFVTTEPKPESVPRPRVPTDTERVAEAIRILTEGLKYHEYDGHDMPKRVAREALVALGVPESSQPW